MLELGRKQHGDFTAASSGITTMRVSQFLSDQQITFEEMVHPPAFTSQKLARFLHISGRWVMKSILLKGSHGFLLAVLPAPQLIDLPRLSAHFGGPVRLATVAELTEHFPDCEWGAVMPFGQLYGLRTILEATIPFDATIVFEAQRHALAIRMQCRDFVMLEHPERVHFARNRVRPDQPRPCAG
jgi:Ala-tRNA(Pro) deacylase